MFKQTALALTTAGILGMTAAEAGTLGVYESGKDGFDTRTYWYDDGEEVTVFDTQFVPSLTEAMVERIETATSNPITRVIVTHPNPDKFNGLSVLHDLGASSIASKATAEAMPRVNDYKRHYFINVAEAFTEKSYPKFEPVQKTFSGRTTIELASGETLTLFELDNPGVASTQTVARIDATGDLIVGDLVHHGAHAWLEGGIVDGRAKPDIDGWLAALDELKNIEGTTVHGGRGCAAPLAEAVKEQKAYLRRMDQLVSDYVDGLGEARSELTDPATAQAHYAEIQERAIAAFPAYDLPYLIGEGVYGLVNSKL
jgi:glyoxylase-like metal-dependent hydrolase (beta-lactamase superfamily II)